MTLIVIFSDDKRMAFWALIQAHPTVFNDRHGIAFDGVKTFFSFRKLPLANGRPTVSRFPWMDRLVLFASSRLFEYVASGHKISVGQLAVLWAGREGWMDGWIERKNVLQPGNW